MDGKNRGSDHIKHQMDDRRALRVSARSDGGQNGSDTGTDVLTEQHVHRPVQTDQSACSQRLQNSYRRGGGLDDGCKDHSRQDAKHRIAESRHQTDEGLRLPERQHGTAHHFHSNEKDAQSGNDLSIMMNGLLFDENHQRHANKCEQRRQCPHIQSNQLSCNRSSDIRSHDDPYRLLQGHHSGIYETNHHDRGGGGRLNDRCNHGAHSHSQETVRRQSLQYAFHFIARRGLQTGAHHLHSMQKESKAPQQTENIRYAHPLLLIFCFTASPRSSP